ncbi:CoA ester lyase [Sulfurimonas sp.]|uniref:CoA ester lyase n=1 Tax=Sulfurimonas sp. TaxID=2022749 RepID=UPI002B463EF7|nr:CoA ester lyase [Sulfurimonas sp.]
MLSNILELYNNRDIKALDELAIPTFRVLNTMSNFSSVIIVNCNDIKQLNNIESIEAKCIMLDLTNTKQEEDRHLALLFCATYLCSHREYDKKLIIQVNSLNSGGYEEITYLNQFMPDAIVVSNINNSKEVKNVLALLHEDVELHLCIQTSESWHNLATLRCEPRVSTFYLGILSLLDDMKLDISIINLDNPTMRYMLSHFLVTCKAMGAKPVSFLCKNSSQENSWLEFEKNMGYDSKLFSNSVV